MMKAKTKQNKRKAASIKENSVESYKTWLYLTFKAVLGVMYIDFVKFELDFENNDTHNAIGAGAVFSINYQPEYHSARIDVYPLAYKIYCQNKNNLVDAIVHELTHIHTTPLANIAQNRYITKDELIRECEQLTDVVSKYISEYIKLTNNSIYS